MKTITGNTYPVKEKLKALGARWNADKKGWDVSDEKEQEALSIVASAGPKTSSTSGAKSGRKFYAHCHECGAPSKGYYYCYDCNLERREGGGMYNGGMSYRDRNGNFVLGDDD